MKKHRYGIMAVIMPMGLVGVFAQQNCLGESPSEPSAPLPAVIVADDSHGVLSYWDLLTKEEQEKHDLLIQKADAILRDKGKGFRQNNPHLIQGLELLRQAWEISPNTGCDTNGGWLHDIYSNYGSDAKDERYREEVHRWFVHWNEIYKKRAEKGDLLDGMRYYFWPANNMDEKERDAYFRYLQRLYTERTGQKAPTKACYC